MRNLIKGRFFFAYIGALLGLGAPLGALCLRALLAHKTFLWTSLRQDWSANSFFYLYMTIGAVMVFTLFGYRLGRRGDRIQDESNIVKDTFETLNLKAITDGLTGLYNHRFLQECLNTELESADRYR